MGIRKHVRDRIGNGYGKADTTEQRDVDEIVPHEADLFIPQTGFRLQAGIGFQLIDSALVDPADPQPGSPVGYRPARAAGYQRHLKTRPLQ